MNVFYWIYLVDILLFINFYFLGQWAVEKESRDTWGDAKTMEMTKSNNLSKEWVKKHSILDFFQGFYYEVQRKLELPGEIYRAIKWFIQRGKRGYSDCDIWGFDYHLSNVIVKGLKDLKGQLHGIPCGMIGTQAMSIVDTGDKAMKEWERIIGEMIWTFEATQHIQEHNWLLVKDETSRIELTKHVKKLNTKNNNGLFEGLPETKYYLMTKKDMVRYKNGWKLFQQYYFSLWD